MEYITEQFIEFWRDFPLFFALLLLSLFELFIVSQCGKRKIFSTENEIVKSIFLLIMRFTAMFSPILIFALILFIISTKIGITIEWDSSDSIAYITAIAGFCVYIYNSCKSILFDNDSKLQNRMHMLLFEYVSLKKNHYESTQVIEWLNHVCIELGRFGLNSSKMGQRLSQLLYDKEGHKIISLVNRCVHVPRKDIKVEASFIEETLTEILILSGDKTVDSFVPVSATIEATKVSEKKKILHVTKKRPRNASEHMRCADND